MRCSSMVRSTSAGSVSIGASASIASVGFSLDGSYEWTDNSSVADLAFDFGVDAVGLGVGTSFTWAHDLAWTDTKFDGSFDLDYTAGTRAGLREGSVT